MQNKFKGEVIAHLVLRVGKIIVKKNFGHFALSMLLQREDKLRKWLGLFMRLLKGYITQKINWRNCMVVFAHIQSNALHD